MSHKNLFKVALLLALFISTAWYTLGFYYSYQAPLCEPDSLVYLQYARNMAEGHPFQFVQGDAPTTGCTSYLYPALLAGLYKIGCTGQRLITASFVLNGAFYLSFILLIGLIARKLAPRFYPFALFAAVLSGQSVYTFFGQTDMGLLMVLFLFSFWAFLTEKKVWLLIGMILAGLTHPTAAALAGGLIATGVLYMFLSSGNLRKKLAFKNSWPIWIGVAGVAAIASTLLFNWLLTGDFIFMSLRSKGLFKLYPFIGAMNKTLVQFVAIFRGIFLGMDNENYRSLFFFPLLTGLIACCGLLIRPWNNLKKTRFDYLVLFAVSLKILLLATNETQAISHDRYIAWVLPLLYIYIAVFLEALQTWLPQKTTASALAVPLILFQLISLLFFTGTFLLACDYNATTSRFSKEVFEYTSPNDTIAFAGDTGQMWNLPDRKILHVSGIVSSGVAIGPNWQYFIETLKYRPELKSDYWLLPKNLILAETSPFLGKKLLTDTDALEEGYGNSLYRADWSALTPSPPTVSKNWKLKDQLDVGYHIDEKRCNYKTSTRPQAVRIQPTVRHDEQKNIVEAGRLILGNETFSLSNITRNLPLHIVLRTAKKDRSIVYQYQTMTYPEHTFNSPLQLTVLVDNRPVDVSLELDDKGITDASFTIPAEYIQSNLPMFKILGDHLSYGYWFYQGESNGIQE